MDNAKSTANEERKSMSTSANHVLRWLEIDRIEETNKISGPLSTS